MNRIHARTLSCLFALTLAMAATTARADDTVCNGNCNYGPNAQIDNLIIKPGATATLNGTHVDGNIFVRPGATLIARNITVGGNIQAENA